MSAPKNFAADLSTVESVQAYFSDHEKVHVKLDIKQEGITWITLYGLTYPVRFILQNAGFIWNKEKQTWTKAFKSGPEYVPNEPSHAPHGSPKSYTTGPTEKEIKLRKLFDSFS